MIAPREERAVCCQWFYLRDAEDHRHDCPRRVPMNVNTPATLHRVAKPNMVMRSFRVRLELWTEAKVKADERQENISDVIREALEKYVKRK